LGWIAGKDGEVRISVWAKPRASKTSLDGLRGDALSVRIAAPPVDGAANAELVKFFSKLLGIAKGDVEISKGATGRTKTVVVRNMPLDEVRARLDV